MHIRILAIGNKMPDWVDEGFYEYAKRFTAPFSLELCEIPAEKRTKNSDIPRIMQREGEKLLAALKPGNLVVALDVKGRAWSTEQLAAQLKNWQVEGRGIDLMIGGPDGMPEECMKKADIRWSLSTLTLPHPLVRILLAEQLYRAMSILQNHPYHR
jgi:23S rRNA (pseudouridine1915-N3)-methyltransferase